MEVLVLTIGQNCYNFCMETTACRIKKLERSLTDAAKGAQIFLQAARKEEEEENLNLESQL